MLLNEQLQPVLNNIFIPTYVVKFGIYSTKLQRIVAIGPEMDKSLLALDDPGLFGNLFQADTVTVGRQEHSVLWYGAQILYFVRPIRCEGEIVGYIFACDNLDKVKADILRTYEKTMLGSVIALIIAIILFQEIFIRFKRELSLFADAIVDGHGKKFHSKITELNPILQYISEQTERMARLDRLNIIGEMAASIGHEVRNPLTTVRGFLQYIGNKQAFETYKSHFLLMIDELDRANGIITDFLSLAKNKVMDFKESDLNTVIREVAPLLEADVLRYNCQLELDLKDVPALMLDVGSLRQVILNIVRNGIEAMPQGGMIKICTYSDAPRVFLTFTDEGTGIPSEIIDKLGTPFFTTKETGTGLGLAVCYRIIQRHNARMVAENVPGGGARFTITFSQAAQPDNEVRK
ncbi:Adaptive-response sensory-kinase SasA [Sporomusa acidovorans DSM 3132]|uniref:histidine kinase n=1 Tax=Sporomusa acidovorans (strain ATCC 49682 / DSM 3132 / Mol) TaxID=1123286 RepID=A0ABZ3J8Q7_SPOA4|nr:ATP-binding protein [Sporomusa acidovorans]OZC17500.1 sporulation kinase E [Sporomusa acidovorans DSM 3132]SDF07593.1 Signal transduction histidine kinase [Sporomusa acidovorans]